MMGVWGLAPSGVQGKAPGQGVRGAKPPEALKLKALFYFKAARMVFSVGIRAYFNQINKCFSL